MILPDLDGIKCCFNPRLDDLSESGINNLEVYYAKTQDLNFSYMELMDILSDEEKTRVARFHSDEDRETFISCHALLRIMLARRLKIAPLEILFKIDSNNKPSIINNPLFFNVTHTRDAFAFGISEDFQIGIDLERVNPSIDFYPIMELFFSKNERDYIINSIPDERNRFFMLWTRKEALLKAIGTGIINNIIDIEVFENVNFLNRKSFDESVPGGALNEYFIYSANLWNNYLSIATPRKATISFNILNKENIYMYLV
jgi:4'-phosphopantetheinyl transferase